MKRAASQVASRRSRGVGMWGCARTELVGTRCKARVPPPVAAPPSPGWLSFHPHSLACGAPAWHTQLRQLREACGTELQLCTVAAWTWGWETAGAPRGIAGRGGKEPSKEDYEAINSRSCYWLRIRRSNFTGHKSLLVGKRTPEKNQTAGV